MLFRMTPFAGRCLKSARRSGSKGKNRRTVPNTGADESAGLTSPRGSAEQSNSFVIYGDRLILKLFRRLQAGQNTEIEIGRYLTETADFDRVPHSWDRSSIVKDAGEPRRWQLRKD